MTPYATAGNGDTLDTYNAREQKKKKKRIKCIYIYTRYAIIKVLGPHPLSGGHFILVLYINECAVGAMNVV